MARFGSSGVMLSLGNTRSVWLDGMAGRLWTLLERGSSLRTACARLRREYGIPVDWLQRDLPAVLRRLTDAGVLVRIS